MKRLLATMFMVFLAPVLGIAQDWEWSTSATALWARPTINWHNDEMSLKGKATLGQFGITGSSPNLSLKYSLTTGFGTGDTITPQQALWIGSTNFGKDPTQTGQQQGQDKPIQLEWSMQPSSRIEIGGPVIKSLRPLMVCEWSNLTMTGTKDDGGKPKTASETLQATFVGVGANADYFTERTAVRALLVGSNGYLFGEVGGAFRILDFAAVTVGWQWKTLKFDKGTTVRVNGGYAGVEVAF